MWSKNRSDGILEPDVPHLDRIVPSGAHDDVRLISLVLDTENTVRMAGGRLAPTALKSGD